MNNRIDLDSIERGWNKYQSDGPIDDYLASLNISRMIAELKRCYEEIDKLRGYLRVWSPVADLTIEECSKPQE